MVLHEAFYPFSPIFVVRDVRGVLYEKSISQISTLYLILREGRYHATPVNVTLLMYTFFIITAYRYSIILIVLQCINSPRGCFLPGMLVGSQLAACNSPLVYGGACALVLLSSFREQPSAMLFSFGVADSAKACAIISILISY